jgi:hypothetical protein
MKKVGFKEARERVTAALKSGLFWHEYRTTLTADGGSPQLVA